ncbi:MAG: hypothetical protein WBN22_10175, partial [Verrucomicrobiia bacterium]
LTKTSKFPSGDRLGSFWQRAGVDAVIIAHLVAITDRANADTVNKVRTDGEQFKVERSYDRMNACNWRSKYERDSDSRRTCF